MVRISDDERTDRESIADGSARRTVSRRQYDALRLGVNGGICGADVDSGIRIPQDDLVGLMVAKITNFQGHLARQFALHNKVPLLHQWVPEIRLNAAEGNRRGQREENCGKNVTGKATIFVGNCTVVHSARIQINS